MPYDLEALKLINEQIEKNIKENNEIIKQRSQSALSPQNYQLMQYLKNTNLIQQQLLMQTNLLNEMSSYLKNLSEMD